MPLVNLSSPSSSTASEYSDISKSLYSSGTIASVVAVALGWHSATLHHSLVLRKELGQDACGGGERYVQTDSILETLHGPSVNCLYGLVNKLSISSLSHDPLPVATSLYSVYPAITFAS